MADLVTAGGAERLRVAMIGCGAIAGFHAAALREVGFTLAGVCGRPGSERAAAFACQHEIERVYGGGDELLADRGSYDAVVIAAPPDATPALVGAALDAAIPVLVEKPVSYRSDGVAPLLGRSGSVIVGYNRRFYRTVLEAREYIWGDSPVIGQLTLPEAVRAPSAMSDDPAYLRAFFSNSVHGLDLARFLFGELTVESVQRVRNEGGAITALAATLLSNNGRMVQFTGNWGAPANFSLTVDRAGLRYEMKPFEAAVIYEGMEVVEPTAASPIRTYRPMVARRIGLEEADLRFKPGFVAQSRALAALVRGESPAPAAILADAHATLVLAEELAGEAFSDDGPSGERREHLAGESRTGEPRLNDGDR